ncbi:hypothetical protein CJ030_MR8G012631 [Morella rubra]|uniref:Uncharacterized protein n=1 Tax=Morella rubra TaxID=262757 RepID=A0A6A1UQQ6_9ROSI|nr:hypothetical protein CJ030_MR8G012631 [Morella rubra]
MPRTKHAAMVGNERAGSSRSSADHSGEPDYFFCNPKCAEKFYNDFSKRKVMLGRKVNVESLSDFEIERPFVKQGWRNLLDMGTEVFPKYVRLFFANLTVGSRERDTLTKCEQFDTAVLTQMSYRRTSKNTWVPKRQGSDEDEDVDEDVAEAEDELEGEEVNAEAWSLISMLIC